MSGIADTAEIGDGEHQAALDTAAEISTRSCRA